MSEHPVISVLMPAYNVESYIGQAIDSILTQSHGDFELIIADDGSTDGTRRMIEARTDLRIRCAHNASNLGYLTTYNKLLTLARGDYITFQDADDYSAPERLARQLAAFRADPALGMVGTAYDIVSADGRLIERITKPLRHEDIVRAAETENPFCGATVMICRAAYELVGGYRPFFANGFAYQDYDRACRVLERFPCANLADPLYAYRQSPLSNSKRISAKRFISDQLVRHLSLQRRTRGRDDLERGDEAAVEAHVALLLKPFDDDPALICRKYAESFMYHRLHRQALEAAWSALKARPRALINHRLLAYCLRVILLRRLGWAGR